MAGGRRDFTGDADHAVEIRTIGRDLEIVNHVAGRAPEIFGERLADARIGPQQEQAFMVFGETKLASGTHHALRFHSADLADFNREGVFLTGLQWK